MQIRSFARRALWLLPLVSTCQLAVANQLQNGSFDAALGPASGGGYSAALGPFVRFDAPNAGIPGWTLTAGSVEVWTDYRFTGNQVLDMTGLHTAFPGAGPGVLEQQFAAVGGQTYQTSFLMGGAATPAIKELEVSILGTAGTLYRQVFTFDTATLPQIGDLAPMQFQFVADGAAATIRFRSLVDSTFDGPYLDSVDISPVPEVPTAVLLALGLPALWRWTTRRARTVRSA